VPTRDDQILEALTRFYTDGELRCAEGPLRIGSVVHTDEILIRGQAPGAHAVRFPERRLFDLINANNVPVSDELVRVLLCLIYHHPEQYRWVTKQPRSLAF
jgi:hypothetical protein